MKKVRNFVIGIVTGELIMNNIIELKNINKYYKSRSGHGESVHVLKNVSLSIKKGELAAITGSSGSGKSTLMNIIGCLDKPNGGSYRLNGKNVLMMSEKSRSAVRNRDIGFIFQGFNLIPALTAEENVMLPLLYRRMSAKERERLARQSLKTVGLSHRADHKPYELSGGQQQRVAIARAIAAKPPMILADEPTGNLDRTSGEIVLEALLKLNASGRTVIIITHDPYVASLAGRRIRISEGSLVN